MRREKIFNRTQIKYMKKRIFIKFYDWLARFWVRQMMMGNRKWHVVLCWRIACFLSPIYQKYHYEMENK